MKIISTCLVLFLSGFAFSQFNRTFMHSVASSATATFTNYSYTDAQNKVNLVSLTGSGSGQVTLVRQQVSDIGDVESFDKHVYNVTLPSSTQNNLLLTAIEQGNELLYVLEIGSASTAKLIWLKVDKNTGALISTVTSANDYKLVYFEPKLIGSELVTYMVKSNGGLTRVALNTGTFTAPTEETADASITNTASFSNTVMSGFKNGNLFVVNGLEKVIIGAGISSSVIITRTATNTYTSANTGITTQRSVSSFLVNPMTVLITNGISLELYDATGTMLLSGTLNGPSNSIASQVEYANNRYHIYYKYANTNQGIFYLVDQNFQVVDSVPTNKTIYHIHKNANGFLLDGSDITKGLSLDLDNNPEVGRVAYCEFYKTVPVLNHDEYATLIKAGQHVTASIGLGTKVITSPNGLPGATYDGLSGCYNLSEFFVGFIGATDMVANDQSSFNDQFSELPGPNTTSSLYDEVLESKYNRPYHVSFQMIEDHVDSVAFGSSAYVPVWAIRNWPAHGNTALGQVADLAPFVDVNSNGTYEPLQGDYPSIYGNDCVFSITHYRSNGDTGKAFEIHSYVYTQACDTSEAFNDVLMRKVQVYSRGAAIDSMFFGGLFDGDLGNYNDDYIGTNVGLGLIYNYNGDLMDENNSGRVGYQDTLAAQGIMVLKGFKEVNDGLDNGIGILPGQSVNGYGFNDGIIDNEYAGLFASPVFTGTNAPMGQTDPVSAMQWYNYLNGLWQFGDQLSYGGTGFPGAPCVTNIETNYMYPGDSDTLNWATAGIDPGFSWSEFGPCGLGSASNPAGDRRGIYSFGKTSLSNSGMFELDYAYLIKRQSVQTTSIFEPVTDLFVKADAVRNAFLDNDGPCGINFDPVPENLGLEESTVEGDSFTVYPNPTAGSVRINGISEAGGIIRVFDMNGKLLQTVSGYQAMQVLDLSELKGNLFILQISNESKTAQKRVVKY
ncbi:T9SS type A sorting domain-containing protein [Fluviicola chungangensis]|uniref:T9SS type A sorting domain-containing protein n=1 Tax=Fluviicola chungangensis TaxID=2597671 RepID=A0A556MY30_9FLAO|nr:T9SS type A sorting domain-containing protein [Fluviicola chungangensis]TSJ44815.1 T9SS type A sorting domain-containing protein [Fluviicola chungangensis]